MIAALPMYDHPGVRAETDALWTAIRDRLQSVGIEAPEVLTRADDLFAQWQSPSLLLGQTCGLPYRRDLHDVVTLVGSIEYDLPDTPPGFYHSLFVARADDPRQSLADFDGALLAYNENASQSGWGAACAAPVRFRLGPATGSHRDSVRAIGTGLAEIAAIDAVSWRLIAAHTDLANPLKVVGRSAPTPGMALITAFPEFLPALRNAVTRGIADLSDLQRRTLGIRGFVKSSRAAYLAVPIPPTPEAYSAITA
jgi:ABC-type phosphate/phosphonate transport system substrate-binding protein